MELWSVERDECPECGPLKERIADLERELAEARMALRLPLMFHAGGPWTPDRAEEWAAIVGAKVATTKVMCDHIRGVLADEQAKEGGDG